nr:hypothetical protein [Pseudodesulfovibrio sp.]
MTSLYVLSKTQVKEFGADMLKAIFTLLGVLLLCSSVGASPKMFEFKGRPISPKIIQDFLPWISDSKPSILSTDLDTAVGSNRYFDGDDVLGKSGEIATEDGDGNSFAYRCLGTLEGGVAVLRTYEGGSGSGVFQSLVFVKQEEGTVYSQAGEKLFHTILRCLWVYELGDRSLKEVRVSGKQIRIGEYDFPVPFAQ